MGFTSRKRILKKSLFSVFLCLWLHGSNGHNISFKIYRGERDIFTNLDDCDDETRDTLGECDHCSWYNAECYDVDQCKHCRCGESDNTFTFDADRRNGSCKSDEEIETESGCYNFTDGSVIKYLDYSAGESAPPPKLVINVSISFRMNKPDCELENEFKFHRDDQNDKGDNADKIFTKPNITGNRIELKFVTKKQFEAWNGSLLILSIRCEDKQDEKKNEKEDEELYCVLLKLESLPPYSDEITSTTPTTNVMEVKTSSTTPTTNVMEVKTSSTRSPTSLTSTTKNAEKGAREETSESGGTNSAVIAVTLTLLLLAIVLVLGCLVFYRRRKRSQVQQNNNDVGVVNYSKEIYEDPNRTYETLDGLSTNQPGTTDTYSYPDSNIIPNTTPSQQEYTYAKDTDFPRSSLSAKAAVEGTTSNRAKYEALKQPEPDDHFYQYPDNTNTDKAPSTELEYTYAKDADIPRGNPGTRVGTQDRTNNAVYHTLEQPSQLNDDFYHYPDNTTITKQPSSELEYTYAKDTKNPRVTADKRKNLLQTTNNAVYHTLEDKRPTTSPDTKLPKNSELESAYAKNTEFPKSLGSAPPASGALYSTRGQEIPAPTEPEYSYAKNTDMPSIQLPTKQTTNEHSFPLPDNNGLYHTLEEPNSPQAPVYSTLEGPENRGPL